MPDAPSRRGWSKISMFQDCEQFWSYGEIGVPELGIATIRPVTKPDYFTTGAAFHEAMKARFRGGNMHDMLAAALDVIDRDCSNYTNLATERERLMADLSEMVVQYVAKRGAKREFEPIEIEGKPAVEIELADTLPSGREITFRLDLVTTYGGFIVVPEHKTTSRDFTLFFLQFALDQKSTGYVWAVNRRIPGTNKLLVNAVKKPRKNSKDRTYDFEVQMFERSAEELSRWEFETDTLLHRMDEVAAGHVRPIRRTANCIDQFGGICPFHGLCRYGPKADLLSKFRTTAPEEEEVNGSW